MNEYIFSELAIGHREEFYTRVTEQKEDMFRELSGDLNSLHQDDEFAREVGGFERHVSFGMLTASCYSTLAGVYLPGKYSLIHSMELKFLKPVYAGDELQVIGTITDCQPALKLITVKGEIRRQNQCVSKATIKIIVLK